MHIPDTLVPCILRKKRNFYQPKEKQNSIGAVKS